MLRIAALLLLFSLLSACGSGDDGGSSEIKLASARNYNAAGVWDNSSQEPDYQLLALIDEQSHAVFYILDEVMFQCPLLIDRDRFTCIPATNYEISGVIDEEEKLTGAISNGNNVIYEFQLDYLDESDNNVRLESFVASWQKESDGYTQTITIDEDGDFTGSDTQGCVINGSIEYISPNVNVQSVKFTNSNCDLAGTFYGKGTIVPNTDTDTDEPAPLRWKLLASSGDWYLNSILTKQTPEEP
ncbi:hypothetical protein [Litoribrevibacter albus]|uniref:Lipoprotein n=1 Tax=Litoribrevibacter albus TaxID=1473156 RepID=A0AA37SBZ6_9GAMM|nr:hypothetical protein [Litoribrevibacter albus]GLQ31761.1 hypothetical protein GCM10007876_22400 [Litoribrevibacter albus]